MNDIVLTNYTLNNITFSRPEYVSKKTVLFNVKYNSKKFIIQTPKLLIPVKPIFNTTNNYKSCSIKLNAYNYNFCNITKTFIKNIESIDKFIKLKSPYFWEKCGLSKNNKKFVPTIQSALQSTLQNNHNTTPSFYCNVQFSRNEAILPIFDDNKNKQSFDYLVPYSKAYSLIMLESVWVKSRKIGLNWTVLQMKVYLPIYKINECLIKDEDELEEIYKSNTELIKNDTTSDKTSTTILVKHHINYIKYFNMTRFGVPDIIIKTKMNNDGLNSDYIDTPNILINDEDKSINKKIINIKPRNFLTDIQTKSNISLNKITDLSKQKIDETDNYKPKLEEILKIRSNLKHV